MQVPGLTVNGRRPAPLAARPAVSRVPGSAATRLELVDVEKPPVAVLGTVHIEVELQEAEKPLVAADLEGIVVRATVDLSGGGERIETTLLLKDGRARLALEGSPLDLVMPGDDAEPGDAWTRWRIAENGDGGFEILDVAVDAWRALAGRFFSPKPDAAPAEFAGEHVRMRTTTLGTTTSTVTERIELALDGTFSRARSVLATIPGPGLGGGVPSIVHVAETATDPARLGGSWALLEDGFTIEFVDADGTTERSLFLDDGGSRLLGGRRFAYTAARIESIDLFALAERWASGRQHNNDWRAVFTEAMSRNAEERFTKHVHAHRHRPYAP